jgi:hypothetical protein
MHALFCVTQKSSWSEKGLRAEQGFQGESNGKEQAERGKEGSKEFYSRG